MMVTLFVVGLASLVGVVCLLRGGAWRAHPATTALLGYDAVTTLALFVRPDIWTPGRYVAVSAGNAALCVWVAVAAGRRARLREDAWASVGFVMGAAGVVVLMLRDHLPGGGTHPFVQAIGAYTIAAAALGTVAQRAHAQISDPIDLMNLWWLGITRWLQLVRMAVAPTWPLLAAPLGALAAAAWLTWCATVCWYALRPGAGGSAPDPRPGP